MRDFSSIILTLFVLATIFTQTASADVTDELNICLLSGQTVNFSYNYNDASDALAIGALYDNGTLVDIKTSPVSESGVGSFVFDKNVNDYDFKLFMWKNDMTPVALSAYSEALGVTFSGNYSKIFENDEIIYSVTDNGQSPMTLFFNNKYSLRISFDIKIESISTDGAIVGVQPYSDKLYSYGVGFCRDKENGILLPSLTVFGNFFQINKNTDFNNKWIHITLDYDDDAVTATYSDPDNGTVYVDNKLIKIENGVGSEYPVNALSFGVFYTGTMTGQLVDASFYVRDISIERKCDNKVIAAKL